MQEEVIGTKKKKPHIVYITIAALAVSQVLTVYQARKVQQEVQKALSEFQREWVQWVEDRNQDLVAQNQSLKELLLRIGELLNYFEPYE